jgi:hypothetical protein
MDHLSRPNSTTSKVQASKNELCADMQMIIIDNKGRRHIHEAYRNIELKFSDTSQRYSQFMNGPHLVYPFVKADSTEFRKKRIQIYETPSRLRMVVQTASLSFSMSPANLIDLIYQELIELLESLQ